MALSFNIVYRVDQGGLRFESMNDSQGVTIQLKVT